MPRRRVFFIKSKALFALLLRRGECDKIAIKLDGGIHGE
jgi:hypothetical protein